MDLGQLTGEEALSGTQISGLAYSSRDVEPGDLFFCVRGYTTDGHDYAPDAIQNGAAALVTERPLGLGVPEFVVDDARAAMPRIANVFYDDPSQWLSYGAIGVTGTNGKTTVTYLIRQIFESVGIGCGLIGTVSWIVGDIETPAVRTTPEAIDLFAALNEMVDAGQKACAIEVSSHALELGRVDGVDFKQRVFTNLTQDHLDFHADMEEYFQAKRKLFVGTGGVINIDDEYGRRLAAELPCTTYSVDGRPADFSATDVKIDSSGSSFILDVGSRFRGPVRIKLPGKYNVSNALAAVAACVLQGVDVEDAVRGISGATGAPGRFEPVTTGEDFGVYVDYAHTPDSIVNVLAAARELPHNRVISVVGAGGDRDPKKRPLMGAAAAEGSDVVYVTSDNPRSEDPSVIIEAVLAGAQQAGSEAEIVSEVDRRAAIEQAVTSAEPGDIVFILGKGHEQGQEFAGGRKIPFDDASVARESLKQRAVSGQ